MKAPYRSHLMFPADEPDKYAKALKSGAHAVAADLEDSIPRAGKAAALEALIAWLRKNTPKVDFQVRVNAESGDFAALRDEGLLGKLSAIVLPKVRRPEDVLLVTADFPVFVIIEEALAVINLEAIAALGNVHGMILGRADMSRALGLTDRTCDLTYIRQRMAVAAHAFGKECMDSCHIVRDHATVARLWKESASFGITGGACIHPAQIPIANEAFTPAAGVTAWCEVAVGGYVAHGGRPYIDPNDGGVVSLPHKRAADRILGG